MAASLTCGLKPQLRPALENDPLLHWPSVPRVKALNVTKTDDFIDALLGELDHDLPCDASMAKIFPCTFNADDPKPLPPKVTSESFAKAERTASKLGLRS